MQVRRFIQLLTTVVFFTITTVLAEGNSAIKPADNPAAQETNEPNTFVALQDYIRYAQRHNAGLKGSYQEWQDIVQGVPKEDILDPKLTYDSHPKETETPAEQERQRVGLNQTFELFGKKNAQKNEAEATAEAARLKYESAKLQILWEVKDTYYEYAYLEQAIELIKKNIKATCAIEEISQTSYEWITATMLAGTETVWLEDKLDELEQAKGPVKAKLNASLNREQTAELGRPPQEIFEPTRLNQSQIVDILRQRNPRLALLDKEIDVAKSKSRRVKTQSYPDIGVGIDFIRTERSLSPEIRPYEKDPTFITLSMKMPFWRESYEAQQKANEAVRKKELERIEAENSILAKAARVINDYDDNAKEMRSYRDKLPAIRELARALETKFRIWKLDLAGLLNARHILLSYQLGYERAAANNRQNLAELEMLAGTRIEQE